MKILYVITGLGLGGAEKIVADLADQMVKLGHNVKIAYLTGEVLVKPISLNVEIVALHLNSAKDFLSASRKYQKLVKHFCPDVVHAHMVHANIFARLNRTLCPVPKLICTAHNSNEGGKVRMITYRLTNYLSDINTNVSQEATEALITKGAFSKNDIITVYNGINLRKFEKTYDSISLNKDVLNFITVGRFNDQKDYPNLINAFAILKNRHKSNIKLTIVGDGKLRPNIETLIKELALDKDITLLGRRSDITELLNAADIFVLASKHEGLPTVVIEAMACECYVVATDCGGSAEILGDTGKLVPIQDSQELAKALENAINLDVEKRLQNNKKARQRVEQLFSLESSVKKWMALYEA
ncbi:N-acetylgalactosamine-N,N'-diacetylbacillosaminyl-diphospho-undecaprenol 4-alpha-N-acetylgalactosaminyltransferase [Psychrobacter sp. SC65A.3]|uniref:glycosyltransferase n=1 Tax=Psychrobacter sp. SC65A.3 TaxID=2983299 RepID=UPI0021DB16B4|nr:glycosyltransferase [Psychrobacter sp. SC65A.3]WAI88440.1 N-acetylgalactosamine-N,N'-diacetylbacillosaminyl-diphospho-undecaprenol 4-alpha-N-acetylgalactosaminyltransferase [Psychrobacter sp. SC65A.3]